MFRLFMMFLTLLPLLCGQKKDAEILRRIQTESERSQAMAIAGELTRHTRVTSTPGYTAAAEAVAKRFKKSGFKVHQEMFSYGRGWQAEKYSASVVSGKNEKLEMIPLPWSSATNGSIRGEAVFVSYADLTKYKGKLRGKFLLADKPADVKATEPKHYTQDELIKLEQEILEPLIHAPHPPPTAYPSDPEERKRFVASLTPEDLSNLNREFNLSRARFYKLLKEEDIAGWIIPSRSALGIRPPAVESHSLEDETPPPSAVIHIDQYKRILKLLQSGQPVTMELEINAQYYPGEGFNLIAELPGKAKPNEVVLLSAHLDTIAGVGATDDASGVAVTMEAMRILKKLSPDRTIRLVLFGGEEQYQIGSRSYVKQHRRDDIRLVLNVDEGAGKIRGVYLEDNFQLRGVVKSWLAPLLELGATTVASRNPAWNRTDGAPFKLAGIPVFTFIQDPLDYENVNHSTADSLDKLSADNLKQAALVVAWLAYKAAQRD